MFRILADNPDRTLALNDLALLAHGLHRCSYLHDALSFPLLFRKTRANKRRDPPVPVVKRHSIVAHVFYARNRIFQIFRFSDIAETALPYRTFIPRIACMPLASHKRPALKLYICSKSSFEGACGTRPSGPQTSSAKTPSQDFLSQKSF